MLQWLCTRLGGLSIKDTLNCVMPLIAQRGWEGVMSKIQADGKIEGVCSGTAVSDDLVYYYHRPAPLNNVHGIGTVLLAGAEVLRLPK